MTHAPNVRTPLPSFPRTFSRLALRAGICGVFLAFGSGCSKSDTENLKVWGPEDHDHQGNPNAGQVDTEARKAAMPDLTKHGIDDVVLVAWKQNCVPCHGVIGRGDGPQGRAVRPPDFTNPGWQRTRIDSEMAHAIKKGRGNMPAFGHLPDSTVDGLVQLVRMLNPDRPREEASPDEATPEEVAPDEGAKKDGAQGESPAPTGTPSAPPAPSP